MLEAIVKRAEKDHLADRRSHLDVSTHHLTVEIVSGYESMIMLLPAEHLPRADDDPLHLLQRLLQLASRLCPRQLAISKRGPKKS